MKRIEFIGASYVGKSTLLQEIEKNISGSRELISQREMILMYRKKIGFIQFRLRKLVEKILSLIKIEYEAYGFPIYENININKLEGYKETIMLCFDEEAQKRFEFKFLFETQKRLLNKISKLIYFGEIEKERFLLAEESIIHWHLVLHELFLEDKIKFQEKHFEDKGLFPSAIVCCFADDNTIKKRMTIRGNENRINKNHHKKSENEILQSVLRKQRFFVEYSQLAERNGIPVLFIDTSEDLSINIERFETFRSKLKN